MAPDELISSTKVKKTQEGFSLVEALVSILVLSIAFTAITALFAANISSANVVRNNFIASALAQEGVELARNLRDSDWHAGSAFGVFGNAGGAESPKSSS